MFIVQSSLCSSWWGWMQLMHQMPCPANFQWRKPLLNQNLSCLLPESFLLSTERLRPRSVSLSPLSPVQVTDLLLASLSQTLSILSVLQWAHSSHLTFHPGSHHTISFLKWFFLWQPAPSVLAAKPPPRPDLVCSVHCPFPGILGPPCPGLSDQPSPILR